MKKVSNTNYVLVYNKSNILYQPDAPSSVKDYLSDNPLDEIRINIKLDNLEQYKKIDLEQINFYDCKNNKCNPYPCIQVLQPTYKLIKK